MITVSSEAVKWLLGFIVTGGFTTFVVQFARARTSLRAGARKSTREVVRDLADDRTAAERRTDIVQVDLEYWRGIAGSYSFQLRANGLTPDPPYPSSPSQAPPAPQQPTRRRKLPPVPEA